MEIEAAHSPSSILWEEKWRGSSSFINREPKLSHFSPCILVHSKKIKWNPTSNRHRLHRCYHTVVIINCSLTIFDLHFIIFSCLLTTDDFYFLFFITFFVFFILNNFKPFKSVLKCEICFWFFSLHNIDLLLKYKNHCPEFACLSRLFVYHWWMAIELPLDQIS